ncbi:GNAT family N-acetyltransferase [Bacillus solimangrovi]|uniref:Phosphinothricin acetyltransferase n=1 Tax=Bacillus solimangrovi TaxID=1305675 RepID=A0A1E5LG55_9BACI|nr:GNAT family N-acetyltransferase [Bacillus solimangrovi]OEH93059.1 phosphinothricin acetyltransferase [Bacillus solimangrovi]
MENKVYIDNMQSEDWEQVKAIYLEGIATGNATFQQQAPSWEEWDQSHSLDCRIVARSEGNVVGWAALSPVSSRCVYGGVAEVSVYVSGSHMGKGIGNVLLSSLIEISEQNGYWTLQSGIFPENKGSIHLHIKNGFREVGRRERIGKMDGMWRDTILFERRSPTVGMD